MPSRLCLLAPHGGHFFPNYWGTTSSTAVASAPLRCATMYGQQPDRHLKSGPPGEIRTTDRLVRSQVLHPAELRARGAMGAKYHLAGRADAGVNRIVAPRAARTEGLPPPPTSRPARELHRLSSQGRQGSAAVGRKTRKGEPELDEAPAALRPGERAFRGALGFSGCPRLRDSRAAERDRVHRRRQPLRRPVTWL